MLSLDNQVPQGQLILGDISKIRRIIGNLLDNAIKFTPSGGRIKLTSQLEIIDENTNWVVCVKDTGIGIPADMLQTIFHPFKQVDSGARRKFGGTGLGLALSQEVAKALGGRITVVSEVGKGSAFTLCLPISIVNEQTDLGPSLLKGLTIENCKIDLKGKTALMIEDHALNAKINIKVIERETGCKIFWSETAEHGIDRFKIGEQFDLIFMDINLGEGLTGLEATVCLLDMLGERCPPIVALTAGILASQRQLVFDVGMVGFLEKPLTKANLNQVLAEVFPHALTCP